MSYHEGSDTAATTCPQCGRPSGCQLKITGHESCWCMKYPRVMPMPDDPNARCLCEDCLQERIAAAQQSQQ